MTPANDFAALVERFEKGVRRAGEVMLYSDDNDRAAAIYEVGQLRAALLAYGAGVERERNDIARWVMQLRELKQWERKDHACAQCDGTLVIEGFVCAYHIAERVALATRPTEARDDG